MANAYIILHHNLTFSSIPTRHYKYIINNVYSSLLSIAKTFPLGIEFNGQTLDIIAKDFPHYLESLKNSIINGYTELIGSSYSQAIFPLIPARVNLWNLEFGLNTYQNLLNSKPQIALLNEQVYSEGILKLYKDLNYKAIIFDWMNAIKDNNWPLSYRFTPVYHSKANIYILWSDCILFQKFQRTVWGELDIDEWIEFITYLIENALKLGIKDDDINLCIYASDAEVFDYKPQSIGTISYKNGQIEKIFKLLSILKDKLSFNIKLPSKILKNKYKKRQINYITTTSYPTRTKKQDKYNITRWAVTGREATRMNTQCHQLLSLIDRLNDTSIDKDELNKLKKELVILWGSDFRTHTIDEKFEFFRHKIGAAIYKANELLRRYKSNRHKKLNIKNDDDKWLTFNNKLCKKNYIKISGRRLIVNYQNKQLVLLLNKGLAIDSFIDKDISSKPLIGTIPHGYFNNISLGSDFFSGHFILLTNEGKQISDLSLSIDEFEILKTSKKLSIRNKIPQLLPNLEIIKTISLTKDGLTIGYNLYAKDLRPASLRLGIITILPNTFDLSSLFFKTHQGGFKQESFYLKGKKLLQDQPVNHIVTSRHCLGFSESTLTIGDKDKEIEIITDPTQLYCVPLFHFEEIDTPVREINSLDYFCRVYFTICERDDVAQVFWKGPISIDFFINTKHSNCY